MNKCSKRIIHQERIDQARVHKLKEAEVEILSNLFKVLSEPGRLKILYALEEGEMCVCDLSAFLNASESSVSHQLRSLREQSLVNTRKEGVTVFYSLTNNIIPEVARYVLECREQ